MSRYHYEQFGVGYVGEPRKESLSPLFFNDDHLAGNKKPGNTPVNAQGGNYKYVNSTRDLTLPLQNHRNTQPMYESPDDEEISVRKYLGVSVGLVSLITENLLSHPFVVLRRQCQVHHSSSRKHLVPFTLLPVIIHLHQRQGITTLWKGLGSCLLVRGMSLAVEDLISKVTPWPKWVRGLSGMLPDETEDPKLNIISFTEKWRIEPPWSNSANIYYSNGKHFGLENVKKSSTLSFLAA